MGRPGKFEAVAEGKLTLLAEELYGETPEHEVSLGGDACVDWYGIYELSPEELDGEEAVIMHEDNDGFVMMTAYAKFEDAEVEMERLLELSGEMLS